MSAGYVDVSPSLLAEWLLTPDDMEIIGVSWVAVERTYRVMRVFVKHPDVEPDQELTPVYTRHDDGTVTADWGIT